MRINKQQIINNNLIWPRLRFLKNIFNYFKENKKTYHITKHRSLKEIKGISKKYNDLIDSICFAINEFSDEKDNFVKLGDYSIDEEILISEITFLSAMGDQMGKVFEYNGEIYRGIYESSLYDFENIWKTGVLQGLAKCGIIPKMEIADFKIDGFPVVLHMEKVFIQKNVFWSYSMVVDACILIAVLYKVLNIYDFTLCDGHLNNVSFNMGRPIFVDIGSIIPRRATGAMEELTFGGLYRLLFGCLGNCMLYRLPSHDTDNCNIYINPRYYNQYTRDYRFCLKRFCRKLILRGYIYEYYIAQRMFNLYQIDPEYIDFLFSERDSYSEIDDEEVSRFYNMIDWDELDKKTITDTGGASHILHYALQNNNVFSFIRYIDFDENRLDESYKNYSYDCDVSFSLVNYIYLPSPDKMRLFKSYAVICVNPLLNNPSFQGYNVQTIVSSLNQLGKNYVAILINIEKDNKMVVYYDEFIRIMESYYDIEEKQDGKYRCIIGRRF